MDCSEFALRLDDLLDGRLHALERKSIEEHLAPPHVANALREFRGHALDDAVGLARRGLGMVAAVVIGKRSLRPPVDRYSITKFSPSMYPYSRNVLRKTFMLGVLSSRVALSSTPIRQILSGCCACALIGSAAAALSAAMNSRRLMGLTPRSRITDSV